MVSAKIMGKAAFSMGTKEHKASFVGILPLVSSSYRAIRAVTTPRVFLNKNVIVNQVIQGDLVIS